MLTVSNIIYSVPPLFANLAKILAGSIDCSYQAINKYSSDGSPYYVRPQAIIYPKTSGDIKHVVSFAREYNMPLTVRGNGTSKTGGSLGEGIIVDLTRHFDHIKQINIMEHTITVDAGVSVKTLREKLHGWHMDISVLTAQDNERSVGGLVATKSVNPSSFSHGTIREWIESMTVVVDEGEEHRISDGVTPSGRLLGIYQSVFPIITHESPQLRASKPELNDDATGYCLWNTSVGPRQLLDELVGSEGTLGIITSVTFRLTPFKPHSLTTAIAITDPKLIPTYTEIAKHHKGEHIFLYDKNYATLVEKYHANLLPQFTDAQYVLLITHFSNDKEKLHKISRTLTRALTIEEKNIIILEDNTLIEKITDKEFLFSLLLNYTKHSQVGVTIGDGLIVPVHFYNEMLEDLEKYLTPTGKQYTITGNAGSGHISLVTLFDPKSSNYEAGLRDYAETIFNLAKKYKGGISAQGGDGLTRTPYLSYMYNEATLTIFTKIKTAWDKKFIFNPGKKLSTTTQYIHNHTAREPLT